MRANHEASVREPGNIRFDVLQSVEDPTRFILHEWYVDEAAAQAHKETAHYLEWCALAEDWMAEPRRGGPRRGAATDPRASTRNRNGAGPCAPAPSS